MQEGFVSLREAANMEAINYKAFHNRISRHKEEYTILQAPREGGGKPEVFISVSSLSPAAQQRYRRQKQKEAAALQGEEAVPWYVETEPGWFIQL